MRFIVWIFSLTSNPKSPRVVLVESGGALIGLVTVKDVLKFIATTAAHEPSWDAREGLGGILEELWTWGSSIMHNLLTWTGRVLRRRQ